MQPPQNPYGTPNPYESGQPGNSPLPSRGVSMDVIGEAWKLVQPNIGPWIGAMVIMVVISGIFSALMSKLGMSTVMTPGVQLPDGTSTPGMAIPTIGPLYYVFLFLNLIVGLFLAGGLVRMGINQTRTGNVDISQLFSASDVIVNLLIAGVISYIAVGIGTVLCIVPGLILAALFSLAIPLIVDGRRGGIDALGESLNLVKPHLGGMIVLGIVLFLINLAGAIPCGLGLLVTYPISITALALVYRDLTGGTSYSGGGGGYNPTAPIAPPR